MSDDELEAYIFGSDARFDDDELLWPSVNPRHSKKIKKNAIICVIGVDTCKQIIIMVYKLRATGIAHHEGDQNHD